MKIKPKKIFVYSCYFFGIIASSYLLSITVSAGELSFHAINVGKADCLLLESNHHYMLVDSGYRSTVDTVLNYLDEQHIPEKKIDYVVATHPDGDHIGGFAKIFDHYHVGQVIYSLCTKTSIAYDNFIDSVRLRNLPFRTPEEEESWKLGDATVTVVYDGSQGTTYNECSIVLRVECDGKSILLTGDLPVTMEESLMEQGYRFTADILKVGHHGAVSSTSSTFLETVNPSYAVICCSGRKAARLPKSDVLKRLAWKFIKTYRTSDGNVVIFIKDGNIITTNKENNEFTCIRNGTVTLSNNVFYANHTPITPEVTLTVNDCVIPSNDYRVTYYSNQSPGTAIVQIEGTGEKYIGNLRTTFSIFPADETLVCSLKEQTNIQLKWSVQKNISGYMIVYTTDSSFTTGLHYIKVRKTSTQSTIIPKLSYDTTYYVKIRAYKNNLGFGKWSPVQTIHTMSST